MDTDHTPRSVEQGSFPRACESCHKVYQNELAFFRETTPVQSDDTSTGVLIQVSGEDGGYLEIFRHCECGATLMERFHNRRDLSEAGLYDRANFEDLLKAIEESGIDRAQARSMLLDFLAGEPDA